MQRPNPIKGVKDYFQNKRKPAISEVVREPTSGGVVYRKNPTTGELEILLIQDSKDRWTIPKGHIEEGETPKATALREISEETGLSDTEIISYLGKINFRYRRADSLVLMSTQIFLVHARNAVESIAKEEWMHDIKWFSTAKALELIEYDDIGKLILIGLGKLRQSGESK